MEAIITHLQISMRAEDIQQGHTERITIMEVAFIQGTIEKVDIKLIQEILLIIAIIQVQKNTIPHLIIPITLTNIIPMVHLIQVGVLIESTHMELITVEVSGADSKVRHTLLEKAHHLIIIRNLMALTFLREVILQEHIRVFPILPKAIKPHQEALPLGQDQEHFLLRGLLQAQVFLPTPHHLLPLHPILLLKRGIKG